MKWRSRNKKINVGGKKSSPKKRFLIVILMLVFLSLIFLFLNSRIFIINTIEVRKEKVDCADDNQIADTSGLRGLNFFIAANDQAEKKLKSKFLCIKSTSLSKIFPSKVNLEVLGREPAMVLINLQVEEASDSSLLDEIMATASAQVSENKDQFLVDNEGVLYAKNDNLDIVAPRLYFSNTKLTGGEVIKGDLLKNALVILNKLKELGFNVLDAKILDNKFLVINSTPKAIFKLDREIDIQLASLQLILQKAKMESSDLEFIDLRFDKPVVKFAPKSK